MKKTLLSLLMVCTGLAYAQTLQLQAFAQGFNSPTEIAHAGDARLFVVQQGGLIRILNSNGTINSTPFLNVSALLSSGSERGLLGLAFHPQYAANGYFYINYTNTAGSTVVARYTRSSTNPDVADTSTATIILTVAQPFSNHNGGCIRFGPDGYLYIGMGDGGSGGDPQNNAQNINSLLGKMLRIDVNNGSPYSNPSTNAFINVTGADEIWATGLRNPWKFSFDRTTGDLWIGDVGQNAIEEINKVAAGTPAGLNFGWRCYEATAAYNTSGCQGIGTYTMPLTQYTHSLNGGCSITGGYVYRGTTYPNLAGKFVFADYCNDRIGYVNTNNTLTFTAALGNLGITTFGEDINGQLYAAGNVTGQVYKVVDTSLSTADFAKNNFTIYPNPANDVVNIKRGTNGTIPAQARIFDLSGKLLLEKQLDDSDMKSIATSNLPAGFYLIQLSDKSGLTSNHKLTIE